MECEKCGLPIRRAKRIMIGRHNGKPIFKRFCRSCRRKVGEENEKR